MEVGDWADPCQSSVPHRRLWIIAELKMNEFQTSRLPGLAISAA